MTWPLGIAIFVTIWWTVLFAVLPFGVRSQHEAGEIQAGTDPGAPVRPLLLKKALWTTVIAAILFAALFYWMEYGPGRAMLQ